MRGAQPCLSLVYISPGSTPEFITLPYLRIFSFLPEGKVRKMSKPAFVFAPGAWHPANSFDNVTSILTEQGYECRSIAFPSVTRATEIKDALLTEDITTIRSVIEPLVDAGRNVVLIMHSWAGVPCCSGLQELTRAERQGKSLDGGVGYLFFINSFFGNLGENLLDFFAEMNINWWVVNVCPSRFPCFSTTLC